ncbi:hypothetical protein AB0J86_35740 [Micromonospora sp. NPDC049559]|uniref:hypothetical protein n=1 Tax=Micromonospora sp. NPDC049559 TaxID=3155923 RepID=UPI0034399621
MTATPATGYDLLASRGLKEDDLRPFLLDCFDIEERELFVGHADRLFEELRGVPSDHVFAAFCSYEEVRGHFAVSVQVGIEGRLVDRVGRRRYAERFAAHFDAYVLYGDTEPLPFLWTVVLPDGNRLLATMDEQEGDAFLLRTATAPIPGLPQVAVDPTLGRPR